MTQKPELNLKSLRIASPCSASWEKMQGDDKMRFCSECKLHVYNFSAMQENEIKELIDSSDGRLCARLFRRRDGTLLTRDCPIGLRFKRRMQMISASVAGCLGLAAFFARSDFANSYFRSDCHTNSNKPLTFEETMSVSGVTNLLSRGLDFLDQLIYGRKKRVMMGKIAAVGPKPIVPAVPPQHVMGEVVLEPESKSEQ